MGDTTTVSQFPSCYPDPKCMYLNANVYLPVSASLLSPLACDPNLQHPFHKPGNFPCQLPVPVPGVAGFGTTETTLKTAMIPNSVGTWVLGAEGSLTGFVPNLNISVSHTLRRNLFEFGS